MSEPEINFETAAPPRIYTVRGVDVVLDAAVARLFGIRTSQLNQQVNRNPEKFGEDFTVPKSSDQRSFGWAGAPIGARSLSARLRP